MRFLDTTEEKYFSDIEIFRFENVPSILPMPGGVGTYRKCLD
jgi:hypothetical protein